MLLLLVILITFHWTNNELSGKFECADCIKRIKVPLNSLGQKVVLVVGGAVCSSPLMLYLANNFEVDCRHIWSFDGMMIGSKNTKDPKERNLLLCHFVHHNFHMDCPRTGPTIFTMRSQQPTMRAMA